MVVVALSSNLSWMSTWLMEPACGYAFADDLLIWSRRCACAASTAWCWCWCWCWLQVKDEIAKYKVGAPARVGLLAPNDVSIPAGGTGEVELTSCST
jgi:hypothetical protein